MSHSWPRCVCHNRGLMACPNSDEYVPLGEPSNSPKTKPEAHHEYQDRRPKHAIACYKIGHETKALAEQTIRHLKRLRRESPDYKSDLPFEAYLCHWDLCHKRGRPWHIGHSSLTKGVK